MGTGAGRVMRLTTAAATKPAGTPNTPAEMGWMPNHRPSASSQPGSALLKRFVVTFDYAHQRMYLRRITPTPPDVGTFDRSGLWINAQKGGYEIVDVARDGPGARAGLAVGDVITAVDGKPVVTEDLADVRRRLRSDPAGSAVELTVRHGDVTRQATLTLADSI